MTVGGTMKVWLSLVPSETSESVGMSCEPQTFWWWMMCCGRLSISVRSSESLKLSSEVKPSSFVWYGLMSRMYLTSELTRLSRLLLLIAMLSFDHYRTDFVKRNERSLDDVRELIGGRQRILQHLEEQLVDVACVSVVPEARHELPNRGRCR